MTTTLRLLEAEDAQTLDPALINDPVSLAVGSEIFEGLTRLDAAQRPIPGLAESWEIGDGGRTYTFHLRAARYQSSVAVQASDALAAWSRALAPSTASPLTTFFAPLGARYAGDPLTGVEVVDQQTLRLRLPRPDSELLTLLALPPYWLYSPLGPGPALFDQPTGAGSGPYRPDRWERGKRLSLSRFDGYWGPRPQVRSVEIEVVPDPVARLQRFSSGGADVVHGLTGPQLLDWVRDPKRAGDLHRVASPRVSWLAFNAQSPAYGPSVRAALAQALDRSRMTDLVLFGSLVGTPANDLLPPALPGHLDRTLFGFDPAAARRALDAAGVSGPIDVFLSTGSTMGRLARELQEQLQQATGRTVVLHPTGDFFKRASLGQFAVFLDTWSADVPHPADLLENVIRSGAQFNTLQLQDGRVDAALDEGRAAVNFDDAVTAYQRAEEIVLADARLIPLYFGVEAYLVRPGLRIPFRSAPLAYRWEDVR